MDLLLATRNPNKTRESHELLGQAFDVIDLSSFLEIAIPEETGRTFEENATLEAIAVSKKLPNLVIADDSGLEVDALRGVPGIFSARYAGENANSKENVSKLLHELRAQNIATEKRSARFRCVIVLAQNGKVLGRFEGVVEGKIVEPPRGSGGVGYDPLYDPSVFDQIIADITHV